MPSRIFADVKAMQALVDLLPIAIFAKDSDSNIQLMNKACEQQWGINFSDVQGTDASQFFPPDQMQSFVARDKEVFANGCQVDFEEVYWNAKLKQNRKGRTFKKPVYDQSGKPLYLICVTVDITADEEANRALRASEEKLRALFELAPLGIARNAMDGTFIEINEAFTKIVGYTVDQLKRIKYWDLTPESYAELEAQQLKLLNTSANYGPYEKEYIHSNGQRVPVRLNGVQITESDNQKYIWSIVEDITERKKTELALRIAATAFEAQVGIMITDADRVIQKVNRTFTEQTGYSEQEAVGQTPRLLKSGRHNAEFYAAMWDSINRTGTWQGEIWDRRKNGEVYPKLMTISAIMDDHGKVIHYVGTQTDISDQKAAESAIKHLAFYDALTQLPNRRLLLDRLQQALVSSERNCNAGALLFIDLDQFKMINDSMGHQAGDILLQLTAERLTACVREGDTVARIGGDEYVVLLEELSQNILEAATQAEIVGKKILASLNQAYEFDKHDYHVSSSIGAVLFKGNKQAPNELLKQSDIAMYQAKSSGRNTIRFFDPEMQNCINKRLTLERELREAIQKREFILYYQIQVDRSNNPVGAEALIRWNHPKLGVIPPAEFIQHAEENGLILPIGQWVLETACAQLQTWKKDPLTCDLVLSINVSAKQFHQPEFVDLIRDAVDRFDIAPNRLKLELTESMLLNNIEDIISTMNALKAIGVRFSLDDFGTGYSSLQYLKQLPINQLKIDRSFVRDIVFDKSDEAIVHTIIAMSETLNLNAIAEGVETEEQMQILLDHGCNSFQGYLFSRPMPIDQLSALLLQGIIRSPA